MAKKIFVEERLRILGFLKQHYPKAFREPGDIKPFKIGFNIELKESVKDILPPDISMKDIEATLRYYVYSKEYERTRKMTGCPRINLWGEIEGEVTKEHVELYKQNKARAKENAKRRREAMKEQEENHLMKEQKQEEAAEAETQKEKIEAEEIECKIKELLQSAKPAKPVLTLKKK